MTAVAIRIEGPDYVLCRAARPRWGHCNTLVPLGHPCPRCHPQGVESSNEAPPPPNPE